MPFVTANGLDFHVQRLGRSRPADVTPVVMLHGLFTGNVASWYFTSAPALASQRQVLLYDLRGHGRSSRPATGYAAAVHATDLAALTAELPPFALVAHSFGSLVAMRFAVEHPERVTALALVEPPITPDGGNPWWAVSGSGAAGDPDRFDPERWLAATDGDPLQRRNGASRQRMLDHISALAKETTLLADLRAEPEITDAELAALPSPLLAVFGRRSRCAEAAPRVARVRPDAEIAILESGHAVHVEATAELTALIDACIGAGHTGNGDRAMGEGDADDGVAYG